MSQRNVERVIGRLVTDEAFRRRFEMNPLATLEEIHESGVELTGLELTVLASVDPHLASRFADAIDPRIQKAAVTGGES